MDYKDTIMSIPKTALIYENGWLEYTRTHKEPKKKVDIDSYFSEAHGAAWVAQNKAQAELSFKMGEDKGHEDVRQFIKDYIDNKGNILPKYTEAEHTVAEEWRPFVVLLDTVTNIYQAKLKDWGIDD